MRKLWFRRKGISTLLGGIIVLSLFLTALASMILISQQYDAYEQIAAKLYQADVQRFSENLAFNYPGITVPGTPVPCVGFTGCLQYTLNITNAANIGTQIARMYINSTLTGCVPACILDPASSPTSSRFRSADRYVNPAETYHLVVFWLPNNKAISDEVLNTISVVTTRGNVFSLEFPIPAIGPSTAPTSGNQILGCLGIKVDPFLVTYTSPSRTQPQVPVPAWQFPYNTYLAFFIEISNVCSAPIKLLDRSGFTAIRYTGAGSGTMKAYYISSPMPSDFCSVNFPNTYCIPTQPGQGNTAPSSNGNIIAYNSTQKSYPGDTCPTSGSSIDPCYVIPAALSKGTPGLPVYVVFSATGSGKNAANKFSSGQNLYVGFLAIYWQCVTNADSTCAPNYTFGITLPFISFSTFPGP
jgi:hypothetical protein